MIKKTKAQIAEEKAWVKLAEKRKQGEWVSLIEAIPDEVIRIQVACLVWWDWFGDREWPGLKKYLKAWKADNEVNWGKVIAELMKIGYPERVANARVGGQME